MNRTQSPGSTAQASCWLCVWQGLQAAIPRVCVDCLLAYRYYGVSMPFPLPANKTQLPIEQYKWLTIEQVIEDNSVVLAAVRRELQVPENVPAIAIGGSYGELTQSLGYQTSYYVQHSTAGIMPCCLKQPLLTCARSHSCSMNLCMDRVSALARRTFTYFSLSNPCQWQGQLQLLALLDKTSLVVLRRHLHH